MGTRETLQHFGQVLSSSSAISAAEQEALKAKIDAVAKAFQQKAMTEGSGHGKERGGGGMGGMMGMLGMGGSDSVFS